MANAINKGERRREKGAEGVGARERERERERERYRYRERERDKGEGGVTTFIIEQTNLITSCRPKAVFSHNNSTLSIHPSSTFKTTIKKTL